MDKDSHFSRKGKYGIHSTRTLRNGNSFWCNRDECRKEDFVEEDQKMVFQAHNFYNKPKKNLVSIDGKNFTTPKRYAVENATSLMNQTQLVKNNKGKTTSKKSVKRAKSRIENAKKVLELNEALSDTQVVFLTEKVPSSKYLEEKVDRENPFLRLGENCGKSQRKRRSKCIENIIRDELFQVN